MGYLKFTSFVTGKVYDSRKQTATTQTTVMSGGNSYEGCREDVLIRLPGDDECLDDKAMSEALGCNVEDVHKVFKEAVRKSRE